MAFNHAEVTKRQLETEDYKLKDTSVLNTEFCER